MSMPVQKQNASAGPKSKGYITKIHRDLILHEPEIMFVNPSKGGGSGGCRSISHSRACCN